MNTIQENQKTDILYGARNEFGIRDSNGNIFQDIIAAYVDMLPVSKKDIAKGYIHERTDRHKRYILLLNQKAIEAIQANKENNTILRISFQIRKSGCYAIGRLPYSHQTNTCKRENSHE
jgi:hypothetical protein